MEYVAGAAWPRPLEVVHQEGIGYRGIEPENVMITTPGRSS